MNKRQFRAACCVVLVLAIGSANNFAAPVGVVDSSFIYEKAPFKSCHASTIVETPRGMAAAWFGGTSEGEKDVGIWFSRREGRIWSVPVEVATGKQDGDNQKGGREPCWNPVLFQVPKGPLLLFYKVGPSPSEWWGMLKSSTDGGMTWNEASRLPDGILGPIKNKPVLLDGNQLLCGSSTEHDGWKVHLELTADWGKTWTKTESLQAPGIGAIQPAILRQPDGALQIVCRSQQKKIVESWSRDAGKTWSALAPSKLPNPNSGIDAVNLAGGRSLVVYNHSERFRSPLSVAVSKDGKEWQSAVTLEDSVGEFSYPAVVVSADSLVHVTYTWQRLRIKHVVLDPAKFELRPIK